MMIKVTFQPDGLRALVPKGTSIIEAARLVGIDLQAPCGGKGQCGKCVVRVIRGDIEPSPSDREHLSQEEIDKGYRLACQACVSGELVLKIPYSTRLYAQKILVEGKVEKVALEPNVKKIYGKLPKPELRDQRGDWERIRDFLDVEDSQLRCDLEVLRSLPQKLREEDFQGTFIIIGDEFLGVEEGDTSDRSYGVALDIGTTTLVATLVDLNSGDPVAVTAEMNPQAVYGEDVVSRINYASNDSRGLEKLNKDVIDAINGMIEDLCCQAGIKRDFIYELTAVGNTTMSHLFLKIPPKYLALYPYVPTFQRAMQVPARELGIHINPGGKIYTFPNIAGFVGGDTVGVILTSRLDEDRGVRLAIDIGTNGEIALSARGRLLVASTAAGPAFEGARISQGMRGTSGAIERVKIDDAGVHVEVIDNLPPRGICGSGLIDAVAQLLQLGILDQTGRLRTREELSGRISNRVLERLTPDGFLLVPEEETGIDGPITLSQRDIRELQLAKGAIAAGIRLLERELGISDENLSEVLLAGAFGNYLDKRSAQTIGLIPPIPLERVKFIGNAASAGAIMALLSKGARERAEKIARSAEHIELATREDFQDEFARAMLFPTNG